MFFGGGLFAFAVLVLWIYCIVDVVSTEESTIRNMPKVLWLLLVIFLPAIGSITWLILGRPQNASYTPGGATPRPQSRPRANRGFVAPDDSPEFLSSLDDRARKLREWEDELKRREDELRKREEGGAE